MAGKAPLGDASLKIVIVGAGLVAPIHLRGWRMLEGVEVGAISSRTRAKAEKLATDFGLSAIYDGFDEMLDAENPDAVDICTPAETHLDYVRAAAARGVHVICQKPIANDLATAGEIRDTAARAQIRLMVHENFRFRVWYREAKRQLESGVIGVPYYCRSDARMPGTVRTSDFPEIPWSLKRQPFFANLDRFLILESAIHQIDVCRYLFGDVHRIFARARRISPDIRGEDLATMVLDFEAMHAVVERSYAARGYPIPPLTTELMAVEGDRGTLFLDRVGVMRIEVDVPGERRTLRPEYDLADAYPNSYAAAIRHFVERLRDGEPFETDIDDNLKTLETTLAAYESVASCQVVDLNFEKNREERRKDEGI